MVEVAREAKNIGAGAGGAFFGVVTTEFPSEVIARSTGLNGGAKVGVKAVVKIIIGLVFLSIARRLPGLWSVFMAVAGWTGIGSIGLDVIAWVKPGGIYRLAEEAAVAIRRATLGAAAVAKELKELEVKAAKIEEVKPAEAEVPARRWIG
jgi:hypothetical protein